VTEGREPRTSTGRAARSVALVVPGDLSSRTGGYIYDRQITDGLAQRGWSVTACELDDSFPWPTPSACAHAEEVFAAIPPGTPTLVDSLALGAIPETVERHALRIPIVALMHMPLPSDLGLSPAAAARLAQGERRALRAAARIVVTGTATLAWLREYDLPPSHVVVIEPGTTRAPLAVGSSGEPLQLLSVGTLNPGKGHEDLLTALAAVPARSWRLTCAGSLTRHAPTAESVREVVRRLNLEGRVELVGELDEPSLERCYHAADLFVLASRRETYGMAVAEALAHGLPVVSTTTGAIPDLVGHDAGILVPPGDRRALADALRRIMTDAALRSRLAAGARRVRERLPGWDRAIASMIATLESVGHG
jgi:glycosyltransferase involved in cell wall biosynthesis